MLDRRCKLGVLSGALKVSHLVMNIVSPQPIAKQATLCVDPTHVSSWAVKQRLACKQTLSGQVVVTIISQSKHTNWAILTTVTGLPNTLVTMLC